MSDVHEKGVMGMFLKACGIVLMVILIPPFLFYGISDLKDAINRVRIDKQYTIEYLEMKNAKCLFNGAQSFVCDPKVVYWNKDTLLVSDDYRCYLIELGKITYREYLEEIPCGNLKNILWQQPIEVWRED